MVDAWVSWTIALSINAVLGVALLEYAWYKTRRFRHPIHELNAQLPELSRFDAPEWKKWKLYPGALTLLIPRLVIGLGLCVFMMLACNVFLIGHDRSKPLNKFR